jgi:hypothetical protein
MADTASTKRASGVVYEGGGTIFSFRQASGGVVNSSDLSAFSKSVGQNLQSVRSDWRSYIRPILNSLPAGDKDQRWSTTTGKGLPSKIDCFVYGVQGSTLFVFNDADSVKADGRYWDASAYRPKTVAEAFEDLYEAISDISTAVSDTSSVDLDPLWAAIGEDYRESSRVGAVGSLDIRTGTLETYISQMNTDIYEPTSYPYQIGTPLIYSIAKNIEELLQLHGVVGWQSDPSGISHGAISPGAHNHTYPEVKPMPATSQTQARVGPYLSLENEILRIRWEIQNTRGSTSWDTDVTSPFIGTPVASLGLHVNYTGSGTASTSNPHGLDYTNTGAETVFTAIRAFTGMSSNSDSSPTYSSVIHVTQGVSLETAIGELDLAVAAGIAPTLDDCYDNGSSDREVRVDDGNLRWWLYGDHKFYISLVNSNAGYGFWVENGSDHFKLVNNGVVHEMSLTADLYRLDIEASDVALIQATNGFTVGATGASSDLTLSGRGNNIFLNETMQLFLSPLFTATSIVGCINELRSTKLDAPSGVNDHRAARFDGTSGDIQNSAVVIDDFGNITCAIVNINHSNGDDTVALGIGNSGSQPGEVGIFVGDRDPTDTITANVGAIYLREDSIDYKSGIYSKAKSSASNDGWRKLAMNPDPASLVGDDSVSGDVIFDQVDSTPARWQPLYINSSGNWSTCDADSSSTMPCMGMAILAGTGSKPILLRGFVRNDNWSWNEGGALYVSAAGLLTQTPPSGAGDIVQIVGWAKTDIIIYFCPENRTVPIVP